MPACPDGHSLEPDERPDHFCDSCDKHGTHYSCPEDCDYDLCKYCFAHLQEHPPPEQRARLKREDAELSAYFGGPYFEGAVFQGKQYEAGKVHNVYSYRYTAPDGYVHVWRHVFDLRELNSANSSKQEDAVVLYHYTNELTFLNVGDMQLTAAKLLASLVDSRAHFGKGIYVTQHEPAVWGRRMRVLLNNYSNGSPLRADFEVLTVKKCCELGVADPATAFPWWCRLGWLTTFSSGRRPTFKKSAWNATVDGPLPLEKTTRAEQWIATEMCG